MAENRSFYKYGGTPLGFEVGQRTDVFRADWPVRATASLYARDVRSLTQVRQRALLVRRSLGFSSLPVWMGGSARSFLRDETEALPFPNPSVLHALRDALYGTPAALLVLAARYSRDSAQSLSTGLTMPRMGYRASVDGTVPISLSDGRTVRVADSFWDFMTAFDPVSLLAEDGTVILRNLDLPVLQLRESLNGVQDNPRVTFSDVRYEKDGVAAALWNNMRSLSDAAYLPPVMSVSPVAAGLDLSCDSLWPDAPGPWRDENSRSSYPVPLEPSIVYSDGAPRWPALTSSGFLPPVTPADGIHRLLLTGSPAEDGWELLSGSVTLGRAHLCPLANGWDDAGELIRLPRRDMEDDLVYSGRQQRLWLTAFLNGVEGASTREGQERTLSAALNRSVFVPLWDGKPFALPPHTTRVDALDYPSVLKDCILTLQKDQLALKNPQDALSLQDLTTYKHVHVHVGDNYLRENVDYSIQDGTTILFAAPVDQKASLEVVAQGRVPFKLDRIEHPQTLSPEQGRTPGAWQGPLLISRGPVVRSCSNVMLLAADRVLPTALGRGISGHQSIPTWESHHETNPPLSFPPFDLDLEVQS